MQTSGGLNERPAEYSFALRCLGQICPDEILDVGAGTGPWPGVMAGCGFKVTAIDEIRGYWQGDFFNRHHLVLHDDITNPKLEKVFPFITCISVIEHIPDDIAAVKGINKLLAPGGYLVLTCPYNERQYVENAYELENAGYGKDNPYICRVFSREQIDKWLRVIGGEIVEQEYYRIFQGNLWTEGGRVKPIECVGKDDLHHLTCILIRKNR